MRVDLAHWFMAAGLFRRKRLARTNAFNTNALSRKQVCGALSLRFNILYSDS
jgi:hypothetical protein